MSYSVHIEQFQGPLDLLLQLIEAEKLEITAISLTQVTEPFVRQVEANRGRIAPEELADFLMIAAKLVYLKSRALMPSFTDPELEEGPDLETQLRMYKTFVEAAHRLGEIAKTGQRSFSRIKRTIREPAAGFVAPVGVTTEMLKELYARAIRRLTPVMALPQAAIERAVTIEEKIHALTSRIRTSIQTSFHSFLSEAKDRAEAVVSFLALLELIKQRTIKVEQTDLFYDIQISSI